MSDVMAPPFAEMPVLFPEEPNGFYWFCSVLATDWPGVFSFRYLLFLSLMSRRFFSF